MADNLKAAAFAAGLSNNEKDKVDELSKALAVHKSLLSLPQNVAQQAFNSLPQNQQQSLVNNFGNQQQPSRGWLGTAWHYTGGALFNALNEISNLSTRVARTGLIALEEKKNLADAWKTAGADGDKVFNPNRIQNARQTYGDAAVNIAMRIAAGEKPQDIQADPNLTPDEKYYLQIADPTNKQLPGVETDSKMRAAKNLFDDTISAVNAAKYSPGRALANVVDLVVPGDFYKNGFFYKLVSGAGDALYRLKADPLLLAGKAKRLYDINKYSLEVVLGDLTKGGTKAADYFAKPATQQFWNTYGAELDNFTKAKQAGNELAASASRENLQRIAPEFGPAVIDNFVKNGITDATSAQAYFMNSQDAFTIMNAQLGRNRVILPMMDVSRKIRMATLTTANKIFNVDNVAPEFVNTFLGQPSNTDGIYRALVDQPELLAQNIKALDKNALRFSTGQIARRIDNLKRKLTQAPIFENDQFDVMAKDGYNKIYQLATTIMPTNQAKLVAETFDSAKDMGKRKDIFYGLWKTIAEVRGLQATEPGQLIVRRLTEKGGMKFATSRVDEFSDLAIFPSEMNQFASAPSLVDLDRAAFRGTFIKKMLGVGNSSWVEKMTSGWSFLTLAGPRYALRNATEDLMVNLALGKSVWGLTKDRYLATRLNTAFKEVEGATGAEKWANHPLGLMMRFVNKGQHEKYIDEINALEPKITSAKNEIASLNAIVAGSTKKREVDAAKARISELTKDIEGGVVGQTRQILARALTEGRMTRWLDRVGLKPLGQDSIDILTDQVIHGDIENFLGIIGEGGMNFASGATYLDYATDFAKKMGVNTAELKIDLGKARDKYAPAAGARGFREIGLIAQSEPAMISWAMRIGFYGNDDLGKFVMARLSDNTDQEMKAVKDIFDWLGKHPKVMEDARITSGKEIDQMQYAQIAYKRVKDLFIKRSDGTLNEELLNKIRSVDPITGEPAITGRLTLDDLPTNNGDIPESVVGPELVPVTNTNNYTTPLMQYGWEWLGLSNSRISRQPIALYEMIDIRKQMRKTGFEDAFLSHFTKGMDPASEGYAAAITRGKQELAQLVEARAIHNVLGYIDNPMVRSQLSFSVRNFARFYRAQEDFYRRIYRTLRYNPEAIQRAALTFDGVSHNGWIQEDDQGNPYFIYPGVEPMYKAMQGVLTALGVPQDFKIPFPVQFGGSLKMLTPSLNPDSILPSFAGPAAALPLSIVSNLVNVAAPGNGDTIVRYTLGKYAVDQPILSRLLPAHVSRALSAMDQNERDSQYASAYRKGVTYLEASGNGLPKKYDDNGNLIPPTAGELEDYRQRVRSATLGVLAVRFAFGFFAPASPSVQLKSDMAEWIRDAGISNWKQNFNKLREKYGGDYNAAMAKWIELYPNQVPYTVTESQRQTISTFGYAEKAGKFVDDNKAMFKEFPQAAAFLIPHEGAFSFDAYRTMQSMGLLKNKRVEDYLKEVQTASALQEYYAKKDEYDNNLKAAGTPIAKTFVRQSFNDWKDRFLAGNPLVAEQLNQGGQKKIDKVKALTDLQNFLASDKYKNIRPDVQNVLGQMVDTYNQYKNQNDVMQFVNASNQVTDALKQATIQRLKDLATYNANTQAAYDTLFASLMGE